MFPNPIAAPVWPVVEGTPAVVLPAKREIVDPATPIGSLVGL
jgi:hypothetical protein